ncbi:hypothetical protein N7488_003795 [Penicillium malachiteum]|nr:hypothetical protein N7488_003795 [Penicillium malachiteum]
MESQFQSHFQGSDSEVRRPTKSLGFPPLLNGPPGYHKAPAGWAHLIRALNFRSAWRNGQIKTPFLAWLRNQPMMREPILRSQFKYPAVYFFERLDNNTAKTESAYMQTVGNFATTPCDSCLSRDGPFATCVKVDGYPGVTSCANCHWWDQDHRCHVDPSAAEHVPAPAPRIHTPPRQSPGTFPHGYSRERRRRREDSPYSRNQRRHYDRSADSRDRRHHREDSANLRTQRRRYESSGDSRIQRQCHRDFENRRQYPSSVPSHQTSTHTTQASSKTIQETQNHPFPCSAQDIQRERDRFCSQMDGHIHELHAANARQIEPMRSLLDKVWSFLSSRGVDPDIISRAQAQFEGLFPVSTRQAEQNDEESS